MYEYLKIRQREYYDKLILDLREEQVEMEALGNWEASGEIEDKIRELKKRKEEIK